MIDKNKTNTSATDAAPAAPKPSPKPRDPYIRAENEDDDAMIPTAIAAPSASRCSKPIPGANELIWDGALLATWAAM